MAIIEHKPMPNAANIQDKQERPKLDMNPAQRTLMTELLHIKQNITSLLEDDRIKDFELQNRLLNELQSHVRALELLEQLNPSTPSKTVNLHELEKKLVMDEVYHPTTGSASTMASHAVAQALKL